jgi:hypothetical protein
MTSRAFFEPTHDDSGRELFVPTTWARGPWGQTISGNYVGGLLGLIGERDLAAATDGMQPARLTVDLLRPVALAPVAASTTVVRAGRRLVLADVVMTQGDATVARASLLYLRRGEQPAAPRFTTRVEMPPMPAVPDPLPDDAPTLMVTYGSDRATPGQGLESWTHSGPKYVWLHNLMPLVAGAEMTPFGDAAMAGDVASSLTGFGVDGLPFINADYTLTLSRLPVGPFLGLAALTHQSDDGISTGTALVVDRDGPVGTATATALANPGFDPPGFTTR